MTNEDIWSKQFYKALEAVAKLTEEEKLSLGKMLVSLSCDTCPVKTENLLKTTDSSEFYKGEVIVEKLFSFEDKKLHSTLC